MSRWRYFTDQEVEHLEPEFVALLDHGCHLSGVRYKIVSAYRSPDHNAEVGGVPDSAHTKGLAVDLECFDSRTAGLIKKGLYLVGLNRIGNYFRLVKGIPCWAGIHVDYDKSKIQNVEWLKNR